MHTFVERLAFQMSDNSGLQQCGAPLSRAKYMRRGMQISSWRLHEAPPRNQINWLHVMTVQYHYSFYLSAYKHWRKKCKRIVLFTEYYKISVCCLVPWFWTGWKESVSTPPGGHLGKLLTISLDFFHFSFLYIQLLFLLVSTWTLFLHVMALLLCSSIIQITLQPINFKISHVHPWWPNQDWVCLTWQLSSCFWKRAKVIIIFFSSCSILVRVTWLWILSELVRYSAPKQPTNYLGGKGQWVWGWDAGPLSVYRRASYTPVFTLIHTYRQFSIANHLLGRNQWSFLEKAHSELPQITGPWSYVLHHPDPKLSCFYALTSVFLYLITSSISGKCPPQDRHCWSHQDIIRHGRKCAKVTNHFTLTQICILDVHHSP